jgi:hypothetical protein
MFNIHIPKFLFLFFILGIKVNLDLEDQEFIFILFVNSEFCNA